MQFIHSFAFHVYTLVSQAICKLRLRFVQNVKFCRHHDDSRQSAEDLIRHLPRVVVPMITKLNFDPDKCDLQVVPEFFRRQAESAIVLTPRVVAIRVRLHDGNYGNHSEYWLIVESSNSCYAESESRTVDVMTIGGANRCGNKLFNK